MVTQATRIYQKTKRSLNCYLSKVKVHLMESLRSLDNVLNYPFDYVIIAVYNEKVMYEIKQELVELGINIQKIIAMKPLSIHEFYV